MVSKDKEIRHMTFTKYLETHPKRYHDVWSEETAKLVNILYGYPYSKENKELLTLFTVYAQYNLPTCAMDNCEITFLVYQFLRFEIRFQSQQWEYDELKKLLTEEIDEEKLSNWIYYYHELRLKTIDYSADMDWLRKELEENEK